MIKLTRLNHVPLIVNADMIEHVDLTPDTVVALVNGQKFMVLESAEEVIDKVIEFRKAILSSTRGPLKIEDLTKIDDMSVDESSYRKPAASWAR
jgi:flagellar protein FlbD